MNPARITATALADTVQRVLALRLLATDIPVREGEHVKVSRMSASVFDPVAVFEPDGVVAGHMAGVAEQVEETGAEGVVEATMRPMQHPGARSDDGSAGIFLIHDHPTKVFPKARIGARFAVGFRGDGSVYVRPHGGTMATGERRAQVVWFRVNPGERVYGAACRALADWRYKALVTPML